MEEACARWQGTQICEKTSAVRQPCSTVRAIGGTVAGLARPRRAVKPQCPHRGALKVSGLDGADRAITTIPVGIALQQIQSLVAQG